MKDETEVKIRISGEMLERIEDKLQELGFRPLSEPTFESNLLFDFSSRTLKQSGCALRLRNYGDCYTLTYKGPQKDDPHLKVREEIETSVGSFDAMQHLLEAIGLRVTFEYSKWRRKFMASWNDGRVEVCLDRTPIGAFVEIEGERDSIHEIAGRLGWNSGDFITESYVDLYREASGNAS